MEILEKLTTEQELKMTEIKEFWLNYINSCKNSINKEKAKIGIDWLYKSIGKDSPIIVYLDSPMSCQIGVQYIKEICKTEGFNKFSSSQVRSQIGSQIRSQVWLQIESQIGSQIESQIWSQVGSQVWSQVGSQVESQVRSQVRSQVGMNFESFCSYGSISDYGWVSFYDFFTQIGVLNHSDFNQFKEILLSGVYDMIQLEGFCIVSELPAKLIRNEAQELHSIDSPAITFNDGYSQYYINGRSIPENYFNSILDKSFTVTDFIKEENEETKSACIAFMQEKYGDDYLVTFFRDNLKEVDTFVDKKENQYLEGTTKGMNVGVYTLFKGKINNEDIAYVRCYCPSTDRMFFLGVDSIHNTAKDAIASLYRIPSKLKDHIKSISRQGERYSTILTESGKNILNSLSELEIADVTGIKGDDYFKLIKFEY